VIECGGTERMTTAASSLYVGFLSPASAQHEREELACAPLDAPRAVRRARLLAVNLALAVAGVILITMAALPGNAWVSDDLVDSTSAALRGVGRQLRHKPILPSWSLAALLYISSSTDNFAVGASVALSGSPHSVYVNGVIAVCNASAALVSAAFGVYLGDAAPTVAPLAAAIIFLYLAYEEVRSLLQGEDASPLAQMAVSGLAWRLAVPMSINNLAGGIAGGVVGIGPLQAGFWALVASYAMFRLGHYVGDNLSRFIEGCLDPRVLAATIFTIVAMMQLHDAAASLSAHNG
jgi:putative Mn2+ efflux pump MntP